MAQHFYFPDEVYDFVSLKLYKEFLEFVHSEENDYLIMPDDLALWLKQDRPDEYKKLYSEIKKHYND